MKDVERSLRESLTRSAESFLPGDLDAAERRFFQRRGRRRMFRAGGGAVLAAAAVAALFVLAQPELVAPPEPRPEPASGLGIARRFHVPPEPLAIAAHETAIWVASREAGIVSRIDPVTGDSEEIELEGASQVVAVGEDAWAAAEGRVLEIGSGTDAGSMVIDWPPDPVDMAAGGERVWLVTSTGCVADSASLETEPLCRGPSGFEATDVTATEDEAWLLEGEAGRLHQVFAERGVNRGRASLRGQEFVLGAPSGRYADLLLSGLGGRDVLWASGEGGRLMRLDLGSGDRTLSQLPGDYVDLAEGYGAVWALIGHEGSDRGEVVKLDVSTGEPQGTAIVLSGKPSDISAGPSGVWVTLRISNEVVQIAGPER